MFVFKILLNIVLLNYKTLIFTPCFKFDYLFRYNILCLLYYKNLIKITISIKIINVIFISECTFYFFSDGLMIQGNDGKWLLVKLLSVS